MIRGTALRIMRRAKDVTQDQVSIGTGIDRGMVSRIENELVRDTPAVVDAKQKIACFLGFPDIKRQDSKE